MSDIRARIVGHRGARGEAPENTLAGFRVAREAGVGEVELDVRLSRDDHLVVLHDHRLKRTTGERGVARDYTLEQLGRFDARRNTPRWPEPLAIPSLAEVVRCCGPSMRFQLEVKRAGKAILQRLTAQLIELIEQYQLAPRVIVTSSHSGFLRQLGARAPTLQRGLVDETRHQQGPEHAAALGCSWLMPRHTLVDASLMAAAHHHRLRVSAWTVNELDEAERLTRLGTDSIITDFPSRFQAHFSRRS